MKTGQKCTVLWHNHRTAILAKWFLGQKKILYSPLKPLPLALSRTVKLCYLQILFFCWNLISTHIFSWGQNLPTLYVVHSQACNTNHYYMKNSTELLFTAVQAECWITQVFFCTLHVSCLKLIHTSIIFIISFDNNLSFSQVSNGKSNLKTTCGNY